MHSISSRPISIHTRELQFPICIKKCNFKYLNYNTPVFTIRTAKNGLEIDDPQRVHYKDVQYFTAPLIMDDADRSENVLVSMICPEQTKQVQSDFLESFNIKTHVMQFTLGELSYHASILQRPLVTIINSYCSLDGKKVRGKENVPGLAPMDAFQKKEIDEISGGMYEERYHELTEYEIFFTRKCLEYVGDCENRDLFGYS